MEIFPLLQAKLLLLSVLIGLITGALFDLSEQVVSALERRLSFFAKICKALGDFFIVASSGIVTVLLCYYFNRGEIRAFCVIGLGMGLILYFFLMSKIVKAVYALIFRTVLGILGFIFNPIVKIVKKLYISLQFAIFCLVKALAKKVNWVYNIYMKKSIFKRAKKGFFLW